MRLHNILSYFIAPAVVFGGLLFWPLLRRRLAPGDRRLTSLKRILQGHLLLVPAGFGFVLYSMASGNRDWLHTLVLPYGLGIISILASLVMLLLGSGRRRHG
jgi:hypothetical protein